MARTRQHVAKYRAELTALFDANEDGRISQPEISRTYKQYTEALQETSAIETRYLDTNGDGQASASEAEAWRTGASLLERLDGLAALKQHDADGDGTLNETETLAALRAIISRHDDARAYLADRFDADGDAKFSDAQLLEAVTSMRQSHRNMTREMSKALHPFDANGNGRIDHNENQILERMFLDGPRKID